MPNFDRDFALDRGCCAVFGCRSGDLDGGVGRYGYRQLLAKFMFLTRRLHTCRSFSRSAGVKRLWLSLASRRYISFSRVA
jgi:hypothetical protein